MKGIELKTKDIPILKKELLEKQDYKCKICTRDLRLEESRNITLDHNHVTGKVRGVLCRFCNSAEGKISKLFIRLGLKKRNVDYILFLRNLAKYSKIKETNYIHPQHTKKLNKRKKPKKNANRRTKRVGTRRKKK